MSGTQNQTQTTKVLEIRNGKPWEVTTETRQTEYGPEILRHSVLLNPLELLRRKTVEMLREGEKADAALPFKAAARLVETCPAIYWGVWLFVNTAIFEYVRVPTSAKQEKSLDRYRRTGWGKKAARFPSEIDFLIAIREHLPEIAAAEEPFQKLRTLASSQAQQRCDSEVKPKEEPFAEEGDAGGHDDPESDSLHQESHRLGNITSRALENALERHGRLSAEGIRWFRLHDRYQKSKSEIRSETGWSDKDYSRLQKQVARAKAAINQAVIARCFTELGTTFEEVQYVRAGS